MNLDSFMHAIPAPPTLPVPLGVGVVSVGFVSVPLCKYVCEFRKGTLMIMGIQTCMVGRTAWPCCDVRHTYGYCDVCHVMGGYGIVPAHGA